MEIVRTCRYNDCDCACICLTTCSWTKLQDRLFEYNAAKAVKRTKYFIPVLFPVKTVQNIFRCRRIVASIWFEIWGGSWIRVKNFDSSRKVSESFDFFHGNFTHKIRFFQVNFRKISIYSGNFTKKFNFPSKD